MLLDLPLGLVGWNGNELDLGLMGDNFNIDSEFLLSESDSLNFLSYSIVFISFVALLLFFDIIYFEN